MLAQVQWPIEGYVNVNVNVNTNGCHKPRSQI